MTQLHPQKTGRRLYQEALARVPAFGPAQVTPSNYSGPDITTRNCLESLNCGGICLMLTLEVRDRLIHRLEV